MNTMKKTGWLAGATVAGLLVAPLAQGVPALQLTILDGYYDGCPNETTCASDQEFTLVALLDPSKVNEWNPSDKFFISLALSPKTAIDDGFGSFAFDGVTIDEALIACAAKDAIILHCLPAHYDEEITYGASRSPGSAIFDQAENRMHAQKAVMALLMA